MKTILSIVLLLVVGFTGCQRKDCSSVLENAANLMAEHPDSALRTLQTMSIEDIHKRADRAEYALLYSQAQDKNYIDVDKDTLIRIATDYYIKRGKADRKALAFFYSGRVFENANNIDTAIIQYVQAEGFVEDTDNIYLKGLINNAMAGIYIDQQFRSLAQNHYIKSADCFREIGSFSNALISYRGVIKTSISLDDYTTAWEYINKAQDLAVSVSDTTFLLSLAQIQASLLTNQSNDYNAALKVLRGAYDTYNKGCIPDSHHFILASIYKNLNKPDSAAIYLNPLLNAIQSEPARMQAEIYYLAGVLADCPHHNQAYQYNNLALNIIDSLYFSEKETAIPELAEKYRNKQLEITNHYYMLTTRYQYVVACLVFLVIAVLFIWAISIYKRRYRQQSLELIEYKNFVTKLQEEYNQLLEIQDDNNNNESSYLKQILDRRIDFLKELMELTASYESKPDVLYKKLKQYLVKDSEEENNILVVFRDLIDTKNPGILNYIKDNFTEVTNKDIDLYCLTCLGLSSSAISLLLGLTPRTVYNRRNHLRKKLKIETEAIGFNNHLESIISEFQLKN